MVREHEQGGVFGEKGDELADDLVQPPIIAQELRFVNGVALLVMPPKKMVQPVGAGKNAHEKIPVFLLVEMKHRLAALFQRGVEIFQQQVQRFPGFGGVHVDTITGAAQIIVSFSGIDRSLQTWCHKAGDQHSIDRARRIG